MSMKKGPGLLRTHRSIVLLLLVIASAGRGVAQAPSTTTTTSAETTSSTTGSTTTTTAGASSSTTTSVTTTSIVSATSTTIFIPECDPEDLSDCLSDLADAVDECFSDLGLRGARVQACLDELDQQQGVLDDTEPSPRKVAKVAKRMERSTRCIDKQLELIRGLSEDSDDCVEEAKSALASYCQGLEGLRGGAVSDLDGDGILNPCEADKDGDRHVNGRDNCPSACNFSQRDRDHDGVGDSCDRCPGTHAGKHVDSLGCSPGQTPLRAPEPECTAEDVDDSDEE